ncbi:MAG: GNAT family N-acetyltransferase [Saprospiraceae bacterium]|nr:GNAT family N-acetyltransferase [Saprospiraceae bacterium]
MPYKYKLADEKDAEAIGQLHALSWQRHYRGIYPDEYLDKNVLPERLETWQKRFESPNERRLIIKAIDQSEKIIGFACTLLDEDSVYGALVDNLHVLQEYQNQGIGKHLLKLSAKWVLQNREESQIYLFVLVKNSAAKTFYSKLGAQISEAFQHKNPAGNYDQVVRCTWTPMELILNSSTQIL